MEQKLAAIVITNYQQYINAGYLVEALMQTSAIADNPTITMYASIAYVDVKKLPQPVKGQRMYNIVLALSIKGKTYTYKKLTDNADYYIAKKGLDVNNYGTTAGKDNHIQVFQKAFEAVVDYNSVKIAVNIALNQ